MNDSINSNGIKIVIISDIVLEPYWKEQLQDCFFCHKLSVEMVFQTISEFLVEKSYDLIHNANMVVVIPNFENCYPSIGYCERIHKDDFSIIAEHETAKMKKIQSLVFQNSSATLIWFGYEDYYYHFNEVLGTVTCFDMLVDKLNIHLYQNKDENTCFIDMKSLIAQVGVANAYNGKNKHRWNAPYSQAMVDHICKEIHKQFLISRGMSPKCIVLDCDYVLWGGVLSEDGATHVQLGNSISGRKYEEFQRFLLFLYYRGVILTICSKNDMTEVLNMFRQHSNMILKEDHIALFQVDWNNKVDKIQKIAKSLNIGLNSLVFIDDSDFEIQMVRHMLPEVRTIKFDYSNIYEQLSCFNLKSNIELKKIQQRNMTYKTNEQRNALKANCETLDDYLNLLETRVDIHLAKPIEYGRLSELTQRTNKCTNGIRYTVDQMKLLPPNYHLYAVSVSDKFSNLGLVGAIGVCNNKLELFSLSCRSLGRNVESQMLFYAKEQGAASFVFSPTGKNEDVKNLIEKALKP